MPGKTGLKFNGSWEMSSESPASSIFPRTDWAGLGQAAEADEARLDHLIRLYWAPLRIFLVATFPSLKDQAEVLLQEFAEDKILKEGWLRRADRNRGKFRDFLKTSLRHFVLDRLNRAEARHAPLSLEELERELPGPGEVSGRIRFDMGSGCPGHDIAADGGRLPRSRCRPTPAQRHLGDVSHPAD